MPHTQLDTGALCAHLVPQLVPQPGHDRPRDLWDEDERHDGRPKTRTIQVLLIRPNAEPTIVTIANELCAMQGLIGGTITTFDTGVPGTIGVAHDEALLLQMPPTRFVPATNALLFGPLFIAADGLNFHSLSEPELREVLNVFAPPLTSEQVRRALRAHDETLDWIQQELDEALDE